MRWAKLLGLLAVPVYAGGILQTNSLDICKGSTYKGLTATQFNITLDQDQLKVYYILNVTSTIKRKIAARVELIAYGQPVKTLTIDPCKSSTLKAFCPLPTVPIFLDSNSPLDAATVKNIPSIAFTIPDLDGLGRATIVDADTNEELTCVEARLSNGKTVNQTGVRWAVALVAGAAFIVSAIAHTMGHSNTSAHIASNTLSLFSFLQAQALFGMTAVSMPPIVQAWTQNFQWTMGLISINFIETIAVWYQRATGGTPTTLFNKQHTQSISVQKRSLFKREDIIQPITIRGIERVGFRANIESSNIFLTGLSLFIAFNVFVCICVGLVRLYAEFAARRGKVQLEEFRQGWKIILRGIIFRVILLGYAQISVLCLWELTARDSIGEVVEAIAYFCFMTVALGWAAFRVIRMARRSISLHRNPAYILYANNDSLNKFGFLYVQFRATAYYFIVPQLVYILLKSILVGLVQSSGVAQAVGLVIVEAGWLIAVSIIRPWMDKRTNAFNISIAAICFLSSVFLLVFSGVFNQPAIVSGVLGVVFFIANAVLSLVLIILVIISSVYAFTSKDPETRYQAIDDDRGSFVATKSNLHLDHDQELDALAAAARGERK